MDIQSRSLRMCMYMCVAAPGCSPTGIPGQSFQSSAGQSGPERPAAPGSGGRCGSSGHPSAAAVSLAVEVVINCYITICDAVTLPFTSSYNLIVSNDSTR